MFDFIDNQTIRTILEITIAIFTGILGFIGGVQYTKKTNKISNIKDSTIRDINQENK